MKTFLAVFITCLPLCCANAELHLVPFRIYTWYDRAVPPSVQSSIHDELTRIMSPLGWDFEWDSLYRDTGLESIRQATVHFRGNCNTDDLTEYAPYPFTLGRTQKWSGHIGLFADIFCDAIRAHLARELVAMKAEDRNAAFGRAVGRVIAHELYHIFGDTQHHSSKGLMKERFSPRELSSEEQLSFQPKEIEKLRGLAVRYIAQWKQFERTFASSSSPSLANTAGAGDELQLNRPVVSLPGDASSIEIGASTK